MTAGTGKRSRTTFIVALLLATLGLAGVLAMQAVASATYHRATAEGVLRDYARAAAEEYADRSARNFEYYGFYPTFRVLQREMRTLRAPVPDPATLEPEDDLERQALSYVLGVFQLQIGEGALETGGLDGDEATQHWLRDTVGAHATTEYEPEWRSAVIVDPAGADRVLAYAVARDGTDAPPSLAYGVTLDPDSVRALFHAAATRAPLLPRTLLRGTDPDSLVAVRLLDAAGNLVERAGPTGAEYSEFTATVPLDPRFGGLVAEVALREDAAALLIIGGLPKGRLPLIAGLLLLAAGLVVAAVTLLRREQELTRLQTEFVSNVSHELRTPLAEIRMFAETLALGRVRSKQEHERSVAIIDQEARRLTNLVENVLHLSRSDRQSVRVSPEPTPLGPVLDHVAEVFAPLAEAKAVELRTAVEADSTAVADRSALQQMLLNLLDNAVKYGPDGQTVTLGTTPVNGVVRVWVEDQGPGIPEGEEERVWQRFSRLDRERDSVVAGTGIGLAVVRELAELHGGRAWLEAADPSGSRFYIELPAAHAETS